MYKSIKATTITIVVAAISIFILILSTSNATALDANWLWGYVKYSNGNGVGSGKPVLIDFGPSSPEPGVAYTNASSMYQYNFYPPLYVYKVSCRFQSGGTWYYGETIINQTLTGDYRADITVYPQ